MEKAKKKKIEADNDFRRLFYGEIRKGDGSLYKQNVEKEEEYLLLGPDFYSYALFAFYFWDDEEKEMYHAQTEEDQ